MSAGVSTSSHPTVGLDLRRTKKKVSSYMEKMSYNPAADAFITITGRHGDNMLYGTKYWACGRTVIDSSSTRHPSICASVQPYRNRTPRSWEDQRIDASRRCRAKSCSGTILFENITGDTYNSPSKDRANRRSSSHRWECSQAIYCRFKIIFILLLKKLGLAMFINLQI